MTDIDFDDLPAPYTPNPAKNGNVGALQALPENLRDRARKLPKGKEYTVLDLKPEGAGHNASLLSIAATCFRMGVSFDDTLEHLQECYAKDRIDYDSAPKRAVQRVWKADGDLSKLVSSNEDGEGLPDAKDEMLLRFRRMQTSEVLELSPDKITTSALEVVKAIFNSNDIINIQHTGREFGTLVKVGNIENFLTENKSNLTDYRFLNPSTFKNIAGIANPNDGNKISTRCNANVKKRKYMLLEMDSKEPEQAERFNHFATLMAKFAPLTMAVDTGGKSVHYWFDASEVSPAMRRQFFTIACIHGADKTMGVLSQIARMPNTPASDEGRSPQRLIYYDPNGKKWPEPGNCKTWNLKEFEKSIVEAKQLDYFYLPKGGFPYWTRDNSERWIQLNHSSLKVELAMRGIRTTAMEGEAITPADERVSSIQRDKNIESALKGASGRHSGFYIENGQRFLVLKSPHIIKAKKGNFNIIHEFLSGFFCFEQKQLDIFCGWLAASMKDFRNDGKRQSKWTPAQMLHIIGAPNSGKTLLLVNILSKCFGGRTAACDSLFKAFPDMHNSEMFEAELLSLDDSPVLETGYQFRQTFGERIKTYTVGMGGAYRGMFQDRVTIKPWWRFVRMMNSEPQTLATLPPLDEGVEDKLIFLMTQPLSNWCPDSIVPGWYDRTARAIADELPGFIHYLLEEFVLPDNAKDPNNRFPVASFKHPLITDEIYEGSPEQYLLYRFDNDAFGSLFCDSMDDDKPQEWLGSGDTLYDLLSTIGTRRTQERFRKACPHPKILLSQLRALEKAIPERIVYCERVKDDSYPRKKDGKKYWIIRPTVSLVAPEKSFEEML